MKKITIETDFAEAIQKLQVSRTNFKSAKIINSISELIKKEADTILELNDDKSINNISSINLSKQPGFLEITITKPNGTEVKQEIKVGKLVQTLLKNVNLKADELADFTNNVKMFQIGEDPSFKVVEGDDILYYYHPDNMVQAGELGNSCMSYTYTQKLLNFYAKNKNVKLFVKTNDENKTIARALLWNTDKGLYLDRQYAINSDLQLAMLREAQHRFELYDFFKEKYNPNFDAKVEVEFINEQNAPKSSYPYLDTFKYLTIYNDKSILYANRDNAFADRKNAYNIYTLKSTDGGFEDADGYDEQGYDENGYDKYGYDSAGYDEQGYDNEGYNEDGYDREGYNKEGYNENGYDRDGYDEDGYDEYGYDRDGYNKEGYDEYGNSKDDE
jgi:hypothetical protein